jgi:Ca2+/Na+ antiporter
MFKRFYLINWTKFIGLYVLIQLGVLFNTSLSILEIINIPFIIMICLFTMFMCNSSIEEVKEIESEPDYEIQKKIWERNKKLNKLL